MTIVIDKVAERVLNVSTGVPVPMNFPAFNADDIFVYYGNDALLAAENVDYTVTLTETFDTFEVTPLAPLLLKINNLIAGDATEINYITIRRKLKLLTDATPAGVRHTPFTSREFERTAMRAQQLADAPLRAIQLGENFAPPYPDLSIKEVPADLSGRPALSFLPGGGFGPGPSTADLVNAGPNAAAAAASAAEAAGYRDTALTHSNTALGHRDAAEGFRDDAEGFATAAAAAAAAAVNAALDQPGMWRVLNSGAFTGADIALPSAGYSALRVLVTDLTVSADCHIGIRLGVTGATMRSGASDYDFVHNNAAVVSNDRIYLNDSTAGATVHALGTARAALDLQISSWINLLEKRAVKWNLGYTTPPGNPKRVDGFATADWSAAGADTLMRFVPTASASLSGKITVLGLIE